jgi:V8-like Glu-specific endopeptidase
MSYTVNDDLFPGSSVVYIESRFGSSWLAGSGVLVGRNDILTASHVIYHPLLGLADEINVFFSYDPNEGAVMHTASPQHYFTTFDPDGDGYLYAGDGKTATLGGSELDVALLSLGVAMGDVYGWMGIDFSFSAGSINVTGHPSLYGWHMTGDTGYVQKHWVDSYIDISGLDVNPGNSGGPLWYYDGNTATVVGVVSTGVAATSLHSHDWLSAAILANDHLIPNDALMWTTQVKDIEVVAATYQFFAGFVPTAAGFEFLISSASNPTDLNDTYYEQFNLENRFINFANNLGSVGVGKSTFEADYGSLSIEDAIAKAYDEIVGFSVATAAGVDVAAALEFLENAVDFYESVALQRVVSTGVSFEHATKIVAVGSILHEAVKAGIGPYASEIEDLVTDIATTGSSDALGYNLFNIA